MYLYVKEVISEFSTNCDKLVLFSRKTLCRLQRYNSQVGRKQVPEGQKQWPPVNSCPPCHTSELILERFVKLPGVILASLKMEFCPLLPASLATHPMIHTLVQMIHIQTASACAHSTERPYLQGPMLSTSLTFVFGILLYKPGWPLSIHCLLNTAVLRVPPHLTNCYQFSPLLCPSCDLPYICLQIVNTIYINYVVFLKEDPVCVLPLCMLPLRAPPCVQRPQRPEDGSAFAGSGVKNHVDHKNTGNQTPVLCKVSKFS